MPGRTNREMVGILWVVLLVPGIHDHWILACKEADQQGSRSFGLPPSTFPPLHLTCAATNGSQWLLSRRDRARYDPNYQSPAVYYNTYPQQNTQYGMYPMPPPVYNNADLPPTYQPPAGATKVDPSQWRAEPTRRPAETTGEASPAYEAPPGPPPAVVQANHTGASTVSNNPYRL